MERQQKKASSKYSFLFPAGLGIGVAIGAAIHNIGVGLAIGAGIGTILSLLGMHFQQRKSEKN
ncbi:MAG: hypothetical protein AMJ88_12715 [Anaerolineae bacterium SM23_ 63]|nr:MAG: hypothetical protein AMJ88_12715 [Anaerolineae bacterium SM23_ 63]HEY48363.1 hypothetical protein [Anaerolineae bacterium]